jgi:AraC-like DNA-binding protein
MVTRLVEVLALQVVRAWALREDAAPSWASGARDPAVGRALARIHAEPDAPWSVASLARVAGCSRSRFSARFTALVGVPPATYLRQVRLQPVADALARGERVGTVAHERGYGSAAAFSRAYKRVTGRSPRQARRELKTDIP